jgi:hypothetical protein
MSYRIDIVAIDKKDISWNWCFESSEIKCQTSRENWKPTTDKKIAENRYNEIDENALSELGSGEYKIILIDSDPPGQTSAFLGNKIVIVS